MFVKYSPQLINKEHRELNLIQTVSDLEQNLKKLQGKTQQLKQENSLLKTKVAVIQQEKEMHALAHAGEKVQWETEKKELTCEVFTERRTIHKEFKSVLSTIDQVKQGFGEITANSTEEFKSKLLALEQIYKKKLNMKNKKIKELENILTEYAKRKSNSSLMICRSPRTRQARKSPKILEKLIQELEKKQVSLKKRVDALDSP